MNFTSRPAVLLTPTIPIDVINIARVLRKAIIERARARAYADNNGFT